MTEYVKIIKYDNEENGPMCLKNISGETAEFSLLVTGTPTMPNLEYSLDGTNWTAYDTTNLPAIEVPVDGKIYLRGTNTSGFNLSGSAYCTIHMNKPYDLVGNLISLINYANMSTLTSLPQYALNSLFKAETNIIHADGANLGKISSVGNYGLQNLFYNNTNLKTPINTSSITSLGGYGAFNNGFYGCTSLLYSADLSNVTTIGRSGGVGSLYEGCTSLTRAVSFNKLSSLPADGSSRFNMQKLFKNCTSLKEPPQFPSLQADFNSGYGTEMWSLFEGCVSLLSTPQLFLGSGNILQSNTLSDAFKGCSSLKTAFFPNSNISSFSNWLQNVSNTGTIYIPYGSGSIPFNSASGIPTGWSIKYY